MTSAPTPPPLPPSGPSVPPAYAAPYPPPPVYVPPPNLADNAGVRMLLPVGRSWVAIVAGYLGLLSILLFPAPFAIGFGIWAIFHVRAKPGRHGLGRAIFGIVAGVAAIVLYGLLFLSGGHT